LPPWPFEFPLLPGAGDDGTEGTVGAVVLGVLGAVGAGLGTVGTVGVWGGDGGVCVVDEPCAGAFEGLLGSVGFEGLLGAVAGLCGLGGLLGAVAVAGLGGLPGGVGFEGFGGFEGWDGFPWLPLFPGADGTVGPFGAFGLFFGPCAFGGRSPCGPFPCGFGCGPGDGTAGFEGFDGFEGSDGLDGTGFDGVWNCALAAFALSCTCCGVVDCGGRGGWGVGFPPPPPPPLPPPDPPFPDPLPPPDFPWPPEWLCLVGGVDVMPAVTSPVSARTPWKAVPAVTVALALGVRPRPEVAARPEVPVDGAPNVIEADAGETYAGMSVPGLLAGWPPTFGSWSTWPVARAQRKMDAATPAPSSPRLAPKRIRPPTKGQITTVSDCSQTSIHQARAESRKGWPAGAGKVPECTVDSA
jgi:hypothetical protein